jgi:hydroxyacylglutathione hydrolase
MKIIQFECLNDNYGFILNDALSGKTICIDTPDSKKIIETAKNNNLVIDEVWNTHWHKDHTGGNLEIAREFGAKCFGPKEVLAHGFHLDEIIDANTKLQFGENSVEIIDLSGHTLGQIGYYFKSQKVAFVGDALFVLGCGRLFEGDASMAYNSLSRLMELDHETAIYCAHEYSQANAKFCQSLGLSNVKLAQRIAQINELRAQNKPTIPTNLALELETNPFLMADFENLAVELGQNGKSRQEIFAYLRKAKDNY